MHNTGSGVINISRNRPPSSSILSDINAFIARWKKSGAAERSNFQSFMIELCEALALPRPQPATENEADNQYVFERVVRFRHDDGTQSAGYIDLYKSRCFVLEGKQSKKRLGDTRARELAQLGLNLTEASLTRTGSGAREGRTWDVIMAAAKQQAEAYAKALPKDDGWPPFVMVVDVGHVIEVFADFSLQGKHYAQFPDRQGYRIYLDDLKRPEVQERLRAIWQNPHSLDPAMKTAEVTREIAALLAKLSQSLEKRGNNPARVAGFLMRCLFTMFAEDVGLLKERAFTAFLEEHKGKANLLHLALSNLWQEMNAGSEYSTALRDKIVEFNGGLFRDATAVVLDEDDLNWLILAAKRDWTNVEPAIFGTLLERALDEKERHKLGAHYTPRAYVERLVVPTIIEPLTDDWRAVQAEAAAFLKDGDKKKARDAVRAFHTRLCNTRVLDPACGSGNFLYVSMELMKRLEGEVLDMLADLGEQEYLVGLDRHTVDPHQFLGLEINPRAVAIAELVLWIGYLQWHFRTRGKVMPAEPVLKAFANIKEQDAALAYDKQEILRDKKGHPLTRWDGVTKKLHPITGEEIPDPDAQLPLYKYVNARPAKWPDADFVVGNPPFIGGKDLRQELGDGYAEALWESRDYMPGGADYVMYWWDTGAGLLETGTVKRVGFISTNSITQEFCRRVIARHLNGRSPVSIVFAIPDHPWLKALDRAAVRIAMTVFVAGSKIGLLQQVVMEADLDTDAPYVQLSEQNGKINSDLSVGLDLSRVAPVEANEGLSSRGMMLFGAGFIVSRTEAVQLGLGKLQGLDSYIHEYRNGRDLTDRPRDVLVIDLFGLLPDEVERKFPSVYQRLLERVKPERDANRDADIRRRWWLFGRTRDEIRPALRGLSRYVATVETAKHRFFQFLPATTTPDNMLVCIADEDACVLGVLSSRIHVTWALAAGGTLEDRPRYNKTLCFDTFPFPDASEEQKARIRALGERLDAFRKERLAEHKPLTMTKMYNVLEKLRANEPLDEKEKAIHEMGLISVLKQIHDELDAAVADAYGWPHDLSDEQILERLVALNKERAAEERKGLIRWLRPEFQAPKEAAKKPTQIESELVETEVVGEKPMFPKAPADQVAQVRAMLAAEGKPIRAGELARKFKQGKKVEARVGELLEIMAAIGQAQTENGSRYFAAR